MPVKRSEASRREDSGSQALIAHKTTWKVYETPPTLPISALIHSETLRQIDRFCLFFNEFKATCSGRQIDDMGKVNQFEGKNRQNGRRGKKLGRMVAPVCEIQRWSEDSLDC